jgi:hypothetical protein
MLNQEELQKCQKLASKFKQEADIDKARHSRLKTLLCAVYAADVDSDDSDVRSMHFSL